MEPIADSFTGLLNAARRLNALRRDCGNNRESIFHSMMKLANYEFLQVGGKRVCLRVDARPGEQLSY